jgi:serine/threonine protein kinase
MHLSREEGPVDPRDPKFAKLMEALINLALKTDQVLLKANVSYQIISPDSQAQMTVELTHDVLIRMKEKLGKDGQYHLSPHCYVLAPITKKKGSQNVGVPDILGTLQVDKNQGNGLIYISDESKHKSRLVKMRKHKISSQFVNKNELLQLESSKKLIESRLSILEAYVPFHAKNIIGKTIRPMGEIESYTKMRKFKGKLLSELLDENTLNTQNRIALSIALLEELRVLHNLGIVHCDIKPENIIVHIDNESGKITVRFIDFDTAKTKNFEGESGFTEAYASPEQIFDSRHVKEIDANKRKKSVDAKSDIWQMGLVLVEVWHGKKREDYWYTKLDDQSLLTSIAGPHLIEELDIFRDIKGTNISNITFKNELSKLLYETADIQTEVVDFDLIAYTIANILQANKNNRIDINQSIDNFEKIRFKYLYPLFSSKMLEKNEIVKLENERDALEARINKMKQNIDNKKFTQEQKEEFNEVLLLNIEKLNEINKKIKLNSLVPLISILNDVNFLVKQFRHSDLFHIRLSPKDIENLEVRGFDPTFYYVHVIMKDENEKNKMILNNEVKDVLYLNSFNDSNTIENIQETTKAIMKELLNLRYQHLNLIFKIKMIFQLLSSPDKNQIIKFSFSAEKKSQFLNPLITMNTLLNKIHGLYQERAHHLNNLDDIKEFNQEFDRKLNALQHSFDDLNDRCKHLLKMKDQKEKTDIILEKDTGFSYFERYEKVLKHLNLVVPDTVMAELKNCIKIGIFEYLDEVTKEKIIPPNRLADLEMLSKILEDKSIKEPKVMTEKIQIYLDKMERRFITASPLQTNIEANINNFLHHPQYAQDVPFVSSASAVKKSK